MIYRRLVISLAVLLGIPSDGAATAQNERNIVNQCDEFVIKQDFESVRETIRELQPAQRSGVEFLPCEAMALYGMGSKIAATHKHRTFLHRVATDQIQSDAVSAAKVRLAEIRLEANLGELVRKTTSETAGFDQIKKLVKAEKWDELLPLISRLRKADRSDRRVAYYEATALYRLRELDAGDHARDCYLAWARSSGAADTDVERLVGYLREHREFPKFQEKTDRLERAAASLSEWKKEYLALLRKLERRSRQSGESIDQSEMTDLLSRASPEAFEWYLTRSGGFGGGGSGGFAAGGSGGFGTASGGR